MKQTSKTNNSHKNWFTEIFFNQFGDLHWIHGKGFNGIRWKGFKESLESIATDSIESFTMDSRLFNCEWWTTKTNKHRKNYFSEIGFNNFGDMSKTKRVSSLKSATQCSTFLFIITQTTLWMWMPITLLCWTVLCHSQSLLTYTHIWLMPIAIDVSLSRWRTVWIRRRSPTLFGRDWQALLIIYVFPFCCDLVSFSSKSLSWTEDWMHQWKLWSQIKALARPPMMLAFNGDDLIKLKIKTIPLVMESAFPLKTQ